MKQCALCTKASVYHVTVLQQGEVKALHFCEQHFHEYMTQPEESMTAEQAEAGHFGNIDEEIEQELSEQDQLSCPKCGITFRQFRDQGRFGCPYDYVAFHDPLVVLLENIHGEIQHQGKIPQNAVTANPELMELIRLRRELANAIESEDYELAAQLRDDIQQLEKNTDEEAKN